MKWCRSSFTDRVADVKIQLPGFCAITSLNLSATVSGVSAEGKVARSALVPVAVTRLVNLFQPFQPPAIERGAFEGRVEQRGAAERQFRHVVAELKRVIEQQQRALDVFVRQQLAQVTAIARLAEL